jgi:tetratricopeptide (TPR) repeat protein
MALPDDLIAAVAEGRAVLFLGSGASRGAKNSTGEEIPLAAGLASELVDEFLGDDYKRLDFRAAYDLSCSQRDTLTVQRFIFDRLNQFEPAEFHLLIPEFAWAGLLTTNYDMIVERSYKNARSRVQRLIPNVKDGDGSTARLDHRSVLYNKLHGCITQYHEVHPPLVASTDQLIAFRQGREGQFDTFLEWAKTKSIVFVGYAFLDQNLRSLFYEIIKEGDNRPRHYIVNRALLPAEATYWSDRRVTALGHSFEEFLQLLDKATPAGKRQLGLLASHSLHASAFTRFITVSGRRESDDLRSYLTSVIDHVSTELRAMPANAAKFYRGFDLGWYPIQAELDIRRTIVNEIISEQIIPSPPAERVSLVVLKGHAGSGKSVTLRRIAWEAATRHNRLCFFVTRNGTIDVARFEEIFSLTNLPIYLFIDDVAEHQEQVLELIEEVRRARAAVRIICAESFALWNILCDDLAPRVSAQYEMKYLSEAEIVDLLSKLEEHNCLGYLRGLPLDQAANELKYVHGRQLLVALLEATHGIPLVAILANEYKSIQLPAARLIYLDICALHRFGTPVRAGLISRIHNITFEQFKDKFFSPLQQIVTLRTDPKSGDFVYEARHPQIAAHVYESVLQSVDERFDNLIRILIKLNPGFTYDMEAVSRLVKASNVESTVSDPNKGRQIYDAALSSVGRKVVILHQRGIYEMHRATNSAELRRAEEYLDEALSLEPFNKSIKHSIAELDLKRSRLASDPIERKAWRRRAIEAASSLVPGSINSYPHTTLVKAAIDEVYDALIVAEEHDTEANFRVLSESISEAENVLRRAHQTFPNDPVLLTQEGKLSETLSQTKRTETAFQRAFNANPRSTLGARRLAKIQVSKGAFDEAISTLRKCLEFNPSARELHFDIALALSEVRPDADQTGAEEILYHLRRTFVPGDRNYQAQFLYARELCIADKYEEAKIIFATLAEARLPFQQKTEVGNYLMEQKGIPRRLIGNVLFVKSSYGFIQVNTPALTAYFEAEEIEAAVDNNSGPSQKLAK